MGWPPAVRQAAKHIYCYTSQWLAGSEACRDAPAAAGCVPRLVVLLHASNNATMFSEVAEDLSCLAAGSEARRSADGATGCLPLLANRLAEALEG